MIDHDKNVGEILDLLDDLKIAENTFVMYSTDNGPHMNNWPDAGMTPFRSEKNTNWEGAFRVPLLVRWPGKIAAGAVSNEIVQHHDWLPTFPRHGRRCRIPAITWDDLRRIDSARLRAFGSVKLAGVREAKTRPICDLTSQGV